MTNDHPQVSSLDEDAEHFFREQRNRDQRISKKRMLFWRRWGWLGLVMSMMGTGMSFMFLTSFREATVEFVLLLIASILLLSPTGGLISQAAFVNYDTDSAVKRSIALTSVVLAIVSTLAPTIISLIYMYELWQAGQAY